DDFSSNRHPAPAFWWSVIFSENRCPPRIKSGAGFSGSCFLAEHDLFRKPVSTFRDHALGGWIVGEERATPSILCRRPRAISINSDAPFLLTIAIRARPSGVALISELPPLNGTG